MLLYVYDSGVNLLGVIEEITGLVWTRRYSACGEFSLLAPATREHARLLAVGRLVMIRGEYEAGEITYLRIAKNQEGLEEIEVKGRLLCAWIGRRVVASPIVATSGYHEIIRRIVTENAVSPSDTARAIPNFALAADDPEISRAAVEYASEPYTNALTAVEDAALAGDLGIKVTTDPVSKTHAFHVYEGRDLTYGNTAGNAPCVFSQEYDNVLEEAYTRGVDNLRGTAYVPGDGALGVVGGEFSGLARREVYVKGDDIKRTYTNENDQEITLTEAQYLALLTQRGAAELKGYGETLEFVSRVRAEGWIALGNPSREATAPVESEIRAARRGLVYGVDYDLGDMVTCVNRAWGVSVSARVSEVVRSWQADAVDIEITFGESLPTLLGRVRKISKGA